MTVFDDLVLDSCRAFGLFRSYVVGASYDNLMAERLRQSYALALRRRALCDEAPVLDVAILRLRSFCSRLDINVLIGRELCDAFCLVSTREVREAFFGYPPECSPSEFRCPVFRRAAQASLRARARELCFRIQEELNQSGIFPVFNTLTTDPRFDHIFAAGDETLKLWFRKVERRFGKFTYCSVLERGAEGKLHWHVLMVFRERRFADPNRSRALADHEEINELKAMWPYGFSSPIAVRYGPTDVYGRLGWRWPRKRKTGSPGQVAGYMAKYVTGVSYRELTGCRTRSSRGFGLRRLVQTSERARETVLTLGSPSWINGVRWSARPPKRLLLRLAFKTMCVERCLRPLPPMRLGSVSIASVMLRTQISSLTSVGVCGVPMAASEPLDRWKQKLPRCAIGGWT